MKNTFLIAATIAFCSFASCNSPSSSSGSATATNDSTAKKMDSKTDANKKTAMASMAGLNAHDVNIIFKDGTSNFMEYGDGSMPAMPLDTSKKMLDGFLKSFPDIKGENQLYVADGNNVMVLSDYTMTFKNDLDKIKATGKTVKFKDVDIFTFDDNGKITSHRNIYPNMAIFAQAGVDMSKMQAMMDEMKKAEMKKQ